VIREGSEAVVVVSNYISELRKVHDIAEKTDRFVEDYLGYAGVD
jgi:hypothetical protein